MARYRRRPARHQSVRRAWSSSLLFHSSRPYHRCNRGLGPGSAAAAEAGAEGEREGPLEQLEVKAAAAAGGRRWMNSTPLDQSGTLLAEVEPQPRYLEDSLERVVGGEVARPNSWPWQISLQYKSGSRFYHTCGGTLIERGWVMTAAHCVDSSRTWRVVIGEHDLQVSSGREQIIGVSQVYIHSRWNSGSVASGYDIALLRLSSDATLNAYAQLGSLPPSGQILPHNNLCYITGWGRTATGGSLSQQLKQAYLPLVDYKTCSSSGWWGSTVKNTMVCGGGGAEAGCNGDSGGPLNCLVNGKYYVHGIASFVSGYGCDTPQKPTVFTRVSAYIEWMNSIMM